MFAFVGFIYRFWQVNGEHKLKRIQGKEVDVYYQDLMIIKILFKGGRYGQNNRCYNGGCLTQIYYYNRQRTESRRIRAHIE